MGMPSHFIIEPAVGRFTRFGRLRTRRTPGPASREPAVNSTPAFSSASRTLLIVPDSDGRFSASRSRIEVTATSAALASASCESHAIFAEVLALGDKYGQLDLRVARIDVRDAERHAAASGLRQRAWNAL